MIILDFSQFITRNSIKLILIGVVAAVASIGLAGVGYTLAGSTKFCGSCHSMVEPYSTWQASNHKQFLCTDCHLPHSSLIKELVTKVKTGNRDVYHELLRDYPAAMMITGEGKEIVNGNCLRCHQSTVENTAMAVGGENCLKCHRSLVHGRNLSAGGVVVE